ncbi:MAG: hypothetical protein RMK74_04870 [Myxococcales bacterium]|nr:hypothetical protein [Myxococcales bacterium]
MAQRLAPSDACARLAERGRRIGGPHGGLVAAVPALLLGCAGTCGRDAPAPPAGPTDAAVPSPVALREPASQVHAPREADGPARLTEGATAARPTPGDGPPRDVAVSESHPVHAATITRCEGRVRVRGAPVEAGAALEPGAVLETERGAEAVLDTPGAARLTVAGGSVVVFAPWSPSELVVGRGSVHAVLPPAGGGDRPVLRLVAPASSVEVSASGELWFHVAGRSAWVGVLSGAAEVYAGVVARAPRDASEGFDPMNGITARTLTAGQAVLATVARLGPIERGTTNLEQARALGSRRVGGSRLPSVAPDPGAAVEAYARADARVRDLEAEHRTVAADRDRALELLRRITEALRHRMRARRAAVHVCGQHLAHRVASVGTRAEPDARCTRALPPALGTGA